MMLLGLGSTILDVTVDPPKILREGMVGRARLEEFIGAL
jgi:tRNA A37 threonylcarbamoyladenosine synthetase subunit TsaC/SUA5/YrdC